MYQCNPDAKLLKKMAKMTKKELLKEIKKSNIIIKRAENNYHKKSKEINKMGKEDKI